MVLTHSAVLESESSLKAGKRFMASLCMSARSSSLASVPYEGIISKVVQCARGRVRAVCSERPDCLPQIEVCGPQVEVLGSLGGDCGMYRNQNACHRERK